MPLRITVDLIPHGVEENARTIGTLYIGNNGSGTAKHGNYEFTLRGSVHGGGVDVWHINQHKGFLRERGYWSLIKDILNSIETDHEPVGQGE